MQIGIHDFDAATTHYVLAVDELAHNMGVDPAKFHIGLGQDAFSMPAPDEDVVTLGATAAWKLLTRHDTSRIRQVILATESGVDQSKSAGVFIHGLLGLGHNVRTVEFKQACFSGTAALQMATDHISRFPEDQILVIASDIARYALDTGGEPTQGAGAVAMLVSADPALVAIDARTGLYTRDINDFWRPNDSTTPYLDGKLSLEAYLEAVLGAWDDYTTRTGVHVSDFHRFIHHQPFTKMARKAHRALAEHSGVELSDAPIEESMTYNRTLGNTYTASLYFGLAAQLHNNAELVNQRVGFFSYGSGSVAEFFAGTIQPGYTQHLASRESLAAELEREALDYAGYRALHEGLNPTSGNFDTARVTTAPFRFAGVTNHTRRYEKR